MRFADHIGRDSMAIGIINWAARIDQCLESAVLAAREITASKFDDPRCVSLEPGRLDIKYDDRHSIGLFLLLLRLSARNLLELTDLQDLALDASRFAAPSRFVASGVCRHRPSRPFFGPSVPDHGLLRASA